MSYMIIGIHGLSNKPEHNVLESGWKAAILEGLKKNEGIDNIKLDFTSVYWADVMYDNYDKDAAIYKAAKQGSLKTYNENWLDTLREKTFDWGGNILDSLKKNFGINSLADKVLESKLKDLYKYYQNNNLRNTLRSRLKEEILKHKDKRIMILSHSMGTIIAYDVLREIGKGDSTMRIDYFITMGSPLGLPHVKYKITQESALIRTPSIVKKWSNFADKRDPVALDTHLASDYAANNEGVQVQDDLVANDWGGINHKSYGYLRTPEVSKVIKNFI